jgi:hypothetical protein
MNPAIEAACIIWDLVQEQRLSIMYIARGEASANKDGNLTKEAAATAKKKSLEDLVPQVKAGSAGYSCYLALPACEQNWCGLPQFCRAAASLICHIHVAAALMY